MKWLSVVLQVLIGRPSEQRSGSAFRLLHRSDCNIRAQSVRLTRLRSPPAGSAAMAPIHLALSVESGEQRLLLTVGQSGSGHGGEVCLNRPRQRLSQGVPEWPK